MQGSLERELFLKNLFLIVIRNDIDAGRSKCREQCELTRFSSECAMNTADQLAG